MMVILLATAGFPKSVALLTLSLAMLATAFILPISGSLLDRQKATFPILFSVVGILLGLICYFYLHHLSSLVVITGMMAFTMGTATLYAGARRITEGMAGMQNVSSAAAQSYAVENAGLGTAAILSALFLKDHSDLLVILDAVSSLLFGIFLWRMTKSIHLKPKNPMMFWSAARRLRTSISSIIPVIFILISIHSIFSGLPSLYLSFLPDPQSATGWMRATNTLCLVLGSFLISRRPLGSRPQTLFIVSGVFITLGFLVAGSQLNWVGVFMGTFFWSVGETLIYPSLTGWIVGLFPADQPGIAVGVKDATIRLSLVSSPLVALFIEPIKPENFICFYAGLPSLGVILIFFKRRISGR